ncbi:hypothetical protein HDU85_001211 [Gaertneriomyces sp. JEL0708]|nr:hypothetical protein HDU85_001211 [Gaertneriomyces sp. JEL0708]
MAEAVSDSGTIAVSELPLAESTRWPLTKLPDELIFRLIRTLGLDDFESVGRTCRKLHRMAFDETMLVQLFVDRFGKDRILEAFLALDKETDEPMYPIPPSWRVPSVGKMLLINRPRLLERLLQNSKPTLSLVQMVFDRLLTVCTVSPQSTLKIPYAVSTIIRSPQVMLLSLKDNPLDFPEHECLDLDDEIFIFCPDVYISYSTNWSSSELHRPLTEILDRDPSDRVVMGFLEMHWSARHSYALYRRLLGSVRDRRHRLPKKWLRNCLTAHARDFRSAGRSEGLIAIREYFPDMEGEDFVLDAYVYASQFFQGPTIGLLRRAVQDDRFTLDYILQDSPPFSIPYGGCASCHLWEMTERFLPSTAPPEEFNADFEFWFKEVYPALRTCTYVQGSGRLTNGRKRHGNIDAALKNILYHTTSIDRWMYLAEILRDIIRTYTATHTERDFKLYRIPPTFMTWLLRGLNEHCAYHKAEDVSTCENTLKAWFDLYLDPQGNHGTITPGIISAFKTHNTWPMEKVVFRVKSKRRAIPSLGEASPSGGKLDDLDRYGELRRSKRLSAVGSRPKYEEDDDEDDDFGEAPDTPTTSKRKKT